MVFSSLSFLIVFLPILLAVYFLTPQRLRSLRNGILLAFSLAFYGCAGARFLLLMAGSIALNYLGGLLCSSLASARGRKAALAAAVALNLALLGFFKYTGFLVRTINALGAALPVPAVTLPIGISFFTFQGLSYVVDVFRGDAPVQKNPLKVALYISFFPQLVAGPIVRYTTVAAEIDTRRESLDEFSGGVQRFAFGLGKKMLLANGIAAVADAAFAAQSPSCLFAWIGALAYTLQIYFDFSAYSDMAIGLGRMFGFHFLENFNFPYLADSVTEFWRRWHISLSSWFRDYVYIPLGGNRCRAPRHIFNLFVVWLLTGLWHGASWNFVLWGLWFFVLLLGEKYLWGRVLARCPSPVRHFYAMLAVVLSWVIFRADGLHAALSYFGALFGATGTLWDGQAVYYVLEYWPEWLFGLLACLPVAQFLRRRLADEYPWYLYNKSAYTEVELPAFTAALTTRGVEWIDMGTRFDALGGRAQFSSTVDNHYSLYGAYETYRAIVERLCELSGSELPFPDDGEITFSALPNHYLGAYARKILDLWDSDEPLLTAEFTDPVPFTRTDNGTLVDERVYHLPVSEQADVLYNLYMGGDVAETVLETDRPELPSILIYGDSFTNAVETMLYYSFDETRAVDLRHYSELSLSDYIALYQPDFVVCVRDYESLLFASGNGVLF